MQTLTDIDTLRAVTDEAARIFTDHARHLAALSYLRQRGIHGSHLTGRWLLGYAPPGWSRLVDKLRSRFSEQALVDAGVGRRCSRGTLIDTFRDRIIFGIREPDGRLAGFIGRDLSGGPTAPKYLNTVHSAIFDKSRLLFGLHEGTHQGTSEGTRPGTTAQQPVVVEGPLDVLALTDRAAGAADLLPVAACGTAFTNGHARLVADAAFRCQAPVVVAMDADSAGRSAAIGVGEQLRRAGLDVRIAMLPNGSDPCEYLSHPGSSLDVFRYDDATPLVTVHAQQAIAAQGDRMQWIEGRLGAARAIVRYLATYPPSYAARQIGWLADTLDLEHTTITHALAAAYDTAAICKSPAPRGTTRRAPDAGDGLALGAAP